MKKNLELLIAGAMPIDKQKLLGDWVQVEAIISLAGVSDGLAQGWAVSRRAKGAPRQSQVISRTTPTTLWSCSSRK